MSKELLVNVPVHGLKRTIICRLYSTGLATLLSFKCQMLGMSPEVSSRVFRSLMHLTIIVQCVYTYYPFLLWLRFVFPTIIFHLTTFALSSYIFHSFKHPDYEKIVVPISEYWALKAVWFQFRQSFLYSPKQKLIAPYHFSLHLYMLRIVIYISTICMVTLLK